MITTRVFLSTCSSFNLFQQLKQLSQVDQAVLTARPTAEQCAENGTKSKADQCAHILALAEPCGMRGQGMAALHVRVTECHVACHCLWTQSHVFTFGGMPCCKQ